MQNRFQNSSILNCIRVAFGESFVSHHYGATEAPARTSSDSGLTHIDIACGLVLRCRRAGPSLMFLARVRPVPSAAANRPADRQPRGRRVPPIDVPGEGGAPPGPPPRPRAIRLGCVRAVPAPSPGTTRQAISGAPMTETPPRHRPSCAAYASRPARSMAALARGRLWLT